jgi:hypothetical protein
VTFRHEFMKRWAKCILCGVLLTALAVYVLPRQNTLGNALLTPGWFCAHVLWPDGEPHGRDLNVPWVILMLASNVALVSTSLWLVLWTVHRLKMAGANRKDP